MRSGNIGSFVTPDRPSPKSKLGKNKQHPEPRAPTRRSGNLSIAEDRGGDREKTDHD
jgi:hypothetical protein